MTDIRPLKKKLRQAYRSIREGMGAQEKAAFDRDIQNRLLASELYQKARSLLCFVSTPIEVETRELILRAWADGKQVAVPKCLDRSGNMEFFRIQSFDELSPGEYALLEPDPQKAPVFADYRGSLCILPAFAFDRDGYRLGFGKGYYDRFLHRYTGCKVGVCYNSCMATALPHGRYDVPADYIVTQKYTLTVKKDAAHRKGDEL